MAKPKPKKRFPFDSGLLILLSISTFTSILTFRKFRAYQNQVEETMRSNLETMRDEHKRSLEDLRKFVNSGLVHSSPVVTPVETNRIFHASENSVPSVYRSLPSGLSIVQCGSWYLTDGIWKYGVGDMSPIGLITNITRGVVMSDIDTFSFCNRPVSSVVSNPNRDAGKFL